MALKEKRTFEKTESKQHKAQIVESQKRGSRLWADADSAGYFWIKRAAANERPAMIYTVAGTRGKPTV